MALVLIVGDEPDTMLRLRIDLHAAGHRTVLAADADTALARLAGGSVDLMLIDVMMPFHDGWTVLEALEGRRRPPVLVVSGRAPRAELARAAQLGAPAYLAKPFTPDELYRAVARALGPAG